MTTNEYHEFISKSNNESEFVRLFQIINEADDELGELREGRTDSELQFIDDISRSIGDFMNREEIL